MRLDHRRDRAAALLTFALMAAWGMSGTASAQLSGGPAGSPPEAPGPTGGEGQPDQAGQPGQGQAGEATAGRPSPVDPDAVPTDTAPLARYIPGEAAGVFFEFPGLNAAPDAWKGSSAFGILNETSFGPMIRELLAQVVEVSPSAPAGTMTGPDVVAVAEHVARHGMIVASPQDSERGDQYRIVVLRNAAHREVRGLFGKLLGTLAEEGTKPEVVGKAGGRQVVVMGSSGDWAWWIEGDDLVLVFNPADAADRVIAALDGQEPNLVDDPNRQALMADEGGFRPLAFGTWRFDRPGASPAERSLVEESGLRRVDLRWGFDGEESLTVVRLEAPAPRSGFMTLFDQPPLELGALPPIPPDVESLSILSVDLAGLYDAILSLSEQGNPALVQPIRTFEQTVKDRARLDFRNDILGSMGPKIATYTMPKPATRPPGRNPIAGMVNALAGLGLPQFVVAIEIDDGASFTQKLDGLILAINQQLGSLLGEAVAASPPAGPDGARGGTGGERPAASPEPPKFSMTLASPRTYLLQLPEGLFGLTGYQPTITMGQQHVIFATLPVLARQCRELESADANTRWSAGGDLAGRLPAELTMLFVSDPSQTMPTLIASLPATLNASLNPPPAPAESGGQPGANSGMAQSGDPGASPEAFASGSPEGSSGDVASGELTSGGGGEVTSGGGVPGAPGDSGQQDEGDGTIRIPASLIPSPDALRRFLSPSVYTTSADDAGVRIEARESLPGQWGLSGLGTGPMIPLPFPGPAGPGGGGGD